jgi:hypothetical protein
MNESDRANIQCGLVCSRSARAVCLQALRNGPREDAESHFEHHAIALQKVTQALEPSQYSLARQHARKDLIGEMRRCLHQRARVARRADTPPLQEKATK